MHVESTPTIIDGLLANRELLSQSRASFYLASRVRMHTPLGAAEFLECRREHRINYYQARVQTALTCLGIYREFFKEEYQRSSAPFFSTQREHEFYRLVHTRLFPLFIGEEETILERLDREPTFFLPYIPVMGLQQHHWEGGCFNFWEIELCFQLAQVLGGNTGAGGKGWQALAMHYGLHAVAEPAPPLAVVGWDLFCHSCKVQDSPLKYLPLAFNMIGYRTGNIWLDSEGIALPWSPQRVAQLAMMREQASVGEIAILKLDWWLREDPQSRIARVVELWNDASEKERESGYGGMLVADLIAGGATDLGHDLILMPAEARHLLQEHLLELEEGLV